MAKALFERSSPVWRASNPSSAFYKPNGCGRDTYIKHFNGSFYEPSSSADKHAMAVTGVQFSPTKPEPYSRKPVNV